jgi:hypothetical protein
MPEVLPSRAQRPSRSIAHVTQELPVDMWTIGQSPNGCASHAYRARKSAESMEMLAFAHIPTGTTASRKNYIFDLKEGERGAGEGPHIQSPALRESVQHGRAARIKRLGRYFLPRERAKNLPVPRQAALLTGTAAAPLLSSAGSGRRDGFPDRT